MTHSRIVVLDDSNYDLDELYEEMKSYGNGVDYVSELNEFWDEDFEKNFKWFSQFSGFNCDMENKTFTVSPFDFWNKMTEDVRQMMGDLISKENRFRLESRISMKRMFWILYNGELFTLPYFVECHGDENETYKVTKFLYYHF